MMGFREIGDIEFQADWLPAYQRVFAPSFARDPYRQTPFQNEAWKLIPLPETPDYGLAPENWWIASQARVVDDFAPLFAAVAEHGDGEVCILGQRRWAARPNQAGFAAAQPNFQLFRPYVFDRSARWGMVVIDDHVTLLGGDSDFIEGFIRHAGGETRLKKRFQDFDLTGGWWVRVEREDWAATRHSFYTMVGWAVPPEPNQGTYDRVPDDVEIRDRWKPAIAKVCSGENWQCLGNPIGSSDWVSIPARGHFIRDGGATDRHDRSLFREYEGLLFALAERGSFEVCLWPFSGQGIRVITPEVFSLSEAMEQERLVDEPLVATCPHADWILVSYPQGVSIISGSSSFMARVIDRAGGLESIISRFDTWARMLRLSGEVQQAVSKAISPPER